MAADTAKLPPFRPLPYKGPNIEVTRGEGGAVYLRSREPCFPRSMSFSVPLPLATACCAA